MKLLGKVGVVSAMTGVSRVFGLVREVVMAHFFGTSTLQSAFVIAFRVPNLFRRLFGEGALGAAFIPIFTEIERTEGRERAQLFASRILGLLICALGLLVGVGIAATFGVERLCGEASRWTEAMPLMRIMLPYAVLICVAAILSAMLQVHERFAIPALTPVVLNVVWIAALVGVCPFLPAEGYWRIGAVSWGILLAGVAQVLFQLPELRRVGYALRPTLRGWRASPYVRRVLLQMGPASLGIALAQINICLDGWLAFYGASWAPSALEYADRIIYLPLGLFGTAFATVLLPTYSRQFAEGAQDQASETLCQALRNLLFLMAPMTLGLMLLAEPTVALIYQRGAFTAQSTLWTARAILAYAPGLLIFSANKVIVPLFYAQKDLRTPVKVASWCILANVTCNVLSVLLLPEGWRHAGIAASTVLSSLLNTLILLHLLRRRGTFRPNFAPLLREAPRVAVAVAAMAALLVAADRLLPAWPLLLRLPLLIALGAAAYALACLALLPQTARTALARFARRFRRR